MTTAPTSTHSTSDGVDPRARRVVVADLAGDRGRDHHRQQHREHARPASGEMNFSSGSSSIGECRQVRPAGAGGDCTWRPYGVAPVHRSALG